MSNAIYWVVWLTIATGIVMFFNYLYQRSIPLETEVSKLNGWCHLGSPEHDSKVLNFYI